MKEFRIDPGLYDYATARELEILQLAEKMGSFTAASKSLDLAPMRASYVLRNLKIKAAKKGYAPNSSNINGRAPEGYFVKRLSARYDKKGQAAGGWVISEPDKAAQLEALEARFALLSESIRPSLPVIAPTHVDDDLLTLYTVTDYHVGMLANRAETGDNWDIKIARDLGIAAMTHMVERSPKSCRAIINIQGDFLHYDGQRAETPTSKHLLDTDTRFYKVVEVATELICDLVALALQKHAEVTLLICEGNHDITSSIWMRRLFLMHYKNEPRVTVHQSASPYYQISHGRTFLGFHHGHLKKNAELPQLFSTRFRKEWGETDYAYIHTGHWHHLDIKEYAGARVIQHPTITASDAHGARHGYNSERAMMGFVYSQKTGEVASFTTNPRALGMEHA